MATEYDMIRLFKRELELCALKPDETMIVLTEGEIRADYARAFLCAAREIGANAFQLGVLPRAIADSRNHTGRTPIAGNRAVVEAARQADLVIDLIGLLFSREQNEITRSGTRMLMVREPFEILSQMFPDEDLRRRVEHGESLLKKSRHLHITSPGGTDVTYLMGDYPVLTQYGYVDTPGRWDHFATGQVLSQACDGKVDGKVVVMPGDLITDFRRYIESPVTLHIEQGHVREITGPGMDAQLLRDYMESFEDPRAFAISHIGWGLHRNAKWFHNALTRTRDLEVGVNSLSFYGNVLFSTGPNTELGGNNDTACHIDIPLRNATLILDGQTIVRDGDIVVEEMRKR